MSSSSKIARLAAGCAALAYGVLGVVVPWKGTGGGEYVHDSEYVIGYALVVAVLGVAVAVGLFRERSRWGPLLVRVGAVALAVGVMWGNVTGDDPSWFVVFGLPGNLLLLVGCVLIAKALWHDGGRVRAFAVMLAVSVPVSLVAAEVGGAFLAAAVWALVAFGVVPPRRAPAPTGELAPASP
jgi:hypothetical protein